MGQERATASRRQPLTAVEAAERDALVQALASPDLAVVREAIADLARHALLDWDAAEQRAHGAGRDAKENVAYAGNEARLEIVVSSLPGILLRRHRPETLRTPEGRTKLLGALRRVAVDRWRWQELLDEYRSLRTIGPKLGREIETAVVARLARREGIDAYAIAQDVQEILLEDGRKQLEYALIHCATLGEFRNLVAKEHVRRALRAERTKTLYDNLRKRVRTILKSKAYAKIGELEGKTAFAPNGEQRPIRTPTRAEIRAAHRAAATVPTVRWNASSDRAGMVYTGERLRELVSLTATTLPTAFTLDHVMEVIDRALAGYFEIFGLEGGSADRKAVRKPESDPSRDERREGEYRSREVGTPGLAAADDAATRFLKSLEKLDPRQRQAFVLLMFELNQGETAGLVDVTRQTIDNWRDLRLAEIKAEAFEGLSDAEEQVATLQIAEALIFEGLLATCEGLLRKESFEIVQSANEETVFGRATSPRTTRPPTDAELEIALDRIAALHRGPEETRPPTLFSLAWCRAALEALAEACPGGFTVENMRSTLSEATLIKRLNEKTKRDRAEEGTDGS